ncbi:G1 family glutamic endopeptidase, partial [Sinomonas sp.]|uniref:G1 family glutamic endopeptidase n=1 Tax=Sinomonas sp. TaxID=1914986 RepID=UPI002FE1AC84
MTSPASPGGTLAAAEAGAPVGSPIFAKAAALHVKWLPTLDCRQVASRHTKVPASSAAYSSSNWSGYAAQTSAPNYAQAEWTVPAVTGNGNQPAYSSIWPGIGGMDSTNELIQDGTEQDAATNGQTSFFWFELYPMENEMEITNLVPNVGDDVATHVHWANGTADFTLCDYTQSTCVTGSQASPAPGNSAEWIVERPTINGSLPDLANYGQVNITHAYYDVDAAGNVQYTPANGADSLVMQDSTGHTMAYPGGLSPDGTSFADHWESYGNAPVASFTASPTSGTAPLSVGFTDTSAGSPTSWSWNFGDGSTSTAQNPSHTYTTAGTYTATLTATNGNGSSTSTATITAMTLAQAMDAKAAQWGLGAATGAVTPIRDGGYYRNYQYGAVIAAPSGSLYVSHGAIRGEWAALGFENGVMGYPSTDEVGGLVDGGVYQNYDGGAIVWSPATGAHESIGAIRSEWQSTGFERGVLGYPATEVVTGLLNGGSYQNYQGGAIVSSPAAGTHESIGAIRSEWQSTGFERGVLGYPSTDVVTGLVNGGSYQN